MLQAMDRETGIVFQRVYLGKQASNQNTNVLSADYPSDLSFHLVSSACVTSLAGPSDCAGSSPTMQRPSMTLTMPTPVVPQSPVFVPHSPITVPKFFEALSESPQTVHPERSCPTLSPASSLASCGNCGLFEFEHGLQCRQCDEWWLACKVWYRAHDGGRRRRLTEPYVRPGESNARNRALMHELGVLCCAATDAMGTTHDDSVPVRTWNSLRRLRRFLNAKAVRFQGLLHPKTSSKAQKGNLEAYSGSMLLRPLRRTLKASVCVAATGLENLWSKLAAALLPRAGDDLRMQAPCDSSRLRFTNPDTPHTGRLAELTDLDCGTGSTGAHMYQTGGSLGGVRRVLVHAI